MMYFLTLGSESVLFVLYLKKRKCPPTHDESELKWLELQGKVCGTWLNIFGEFLAFVIENIHECLWSCIVCKL